MNDSNITRMFLTTAVLAAVAALLAVPAQAMFVSDGGAVVTSEPPAAPGSPGEVSSLTGDTALKVDRAVAAANEAYDTYRDKTAIAAREALFTGQQPSVGLTGDSALTRDDMSSSTTTQAVSSGDGFDWAWVGVSGGAALLAAAMGGFYLGTRHRGRIALQ